LLSDAGLIDAAGSAGAALLVLYAAFWAFSVWRRLSVRLFRNQAFGMGIVAVGFALLDLDHSTPLITGADTVGPELRFIHFIVFAVLFYWVDASILAARRTDPLLRDVFHWRYLRYLFWILLVASIVVTILAQSQILFVGSLFLVALSGAVLLPVAASRSGDASLRRQLKWFGAFSLLTFMIIILRGVLGYNEIVYFVVATLGLTYTANYSLYRSAKSLVPLNKLSEAEISA
jgi:hypothetical protein